MKRSIAALAATAALLVFASTAVAGEALPTDPSTSTSTPTTETPTTTTSTPPATTTTVPSTTTSVPTTTTSVPTTTDTTPCLTDCIPDTEDCIGAECLPSAGGGLPTAVGAGALPFTGIEDTIAPLLLALVVLLGGVVAWRWAQLREAVAEAASRAREMPARTASRGIVRTGYTGAMRQIEIEHRARQVFTPRVA